MHNDRVDSQTIGFGTMRLAGDGAWGPPASWDRSVRLLRAAFESGVRLFDTAWYYGPLVTNSLLRAALHPFPEDVTLITKVGNSHPTRHTWRPTFEPADLRNACETDLMTLGLDELPLTMLRWLPQKADLAKFQDALLVLIDLKDRGWIKSIGLSNISERHLTTALRMTNIAAVSNSLSLFSRQDTTIVRHCTSRNIPYLPYYPLLGGDVVRRASVEAVARQLDATPAQIGLAWLRHQSPVVIPIPGTRNFAHMHENIAASKLRIPFDVMDYLNGLHGARTA